MSDLRNRLLDDLHRRVLRLANAPCSDLHQQLSSVIWAADGIRPSQKMRDDRGRFVKSGAGGER